MTAATQHAPLDLVVRGGHLVLTDLGGATTVRQLDLGIRGGAIATVGRETDRWPARSVLDARDCVVTPGFVNCHNHSYAASRAGLDADAPLGVLIPKARGLAAEMNDERQYVSARMLAETMLRAGVTTLLDQPAQGVAEPFEVARGYRDTGIRAFVAPMVSDRPYEPWLRHRSADEQVPAPASSARSTSPAGPAGPAETEAILAAVEHFVTSWRDPAGLVCAALGPYAVGVCSDRLLTGMAELSRRFGVPMHTHLAEAWWQAEGALQDTGESLVRRLHRLGVLGPAFSMAHAVWLDDDEIGLLAAAGSSVVHNPMSNLMLGSGIAPVPRMRRAGVGVCLGSDGLNCGCVADFFEHMRLSVALHRPAGGPWDAWAAAGDALRSATVAGAQALDRADEFGGIRVGLRADLVVHAGVPVADDDDGRDTVTRLVYTGSAAGVRDVLVNGQRRVSNGALVPGRERV